MSVLRDDSSHIMSDKEVKDEKNEKDARYRSMETACHIGSPLCAGMGSLVLCYFRVHQGSPRMSIVCASSYFVYGGALIFYRKYIMSCVPVL